MLAGLEGTLAHPTSAALSAPPLRGIATGVRPTTLVTRRVRYTAASVARVARTTTTAVARTGRTTILAPRTTRALSAPSLHGTVTGALTTTPATPKDPYTDA